MMYLMKLKDYLLGLTIDGTVSSTMDWTMCGCAVAVLLANHRLKHAYADGFSFERFC